MQHTITLVINPSQIQIYFLSQIHLSDKAGGGDKFRVHEISISDFANPDGAYRRKISWNKFTCAQYFVLYTFISAEILVGLKKIKTQVFVTRYFTKLNINEIKINNLSKIKLNWYFTKNVYFQWKGFPLWCCTCRGGEKYEKVHLNNFF